MLELKEKARREKTSLTRVLNQTLRAGLLAARRSAPRKRYRQRTYSMGAPRIDLRKALSVAASLEDEEILRKTMMRK